MSAPTIRMLLLASMPLLAVQCTQYSDAQSTKAPGREPSYYTLLTSGMLSSPVFAYAFSTGKFRVEVRNLVIGHAKASDVPTPTDVLMELRGGTVTTTINGQTQERAEGDFWTIGKGSQVDIDNNGQVAVIRALYVYPGAT
jgi:hypothetical protein